MSVCVAGNRYRAAAQQHIDPRSGLIKRTNAWEAGDWTEGGGSSPLLSSPQPPPSGHHHSSAFVMGPEGAVERAAEGAPGRPRLVIDKPAAPLV